MSYLAEANEKWHGHFVHGEGGGDKTFRKLDRCHLWMAHYVLVSDSPATSIHVATGIVIKPKLVTLSIMIWLTQESSSRLPLEAGVGVYWDCAAEGGCRRRQRREDHRQHQGVEGPARGRRLSRGGGLVALFRVTYRPFVVVCKNSSSSAIIVVIVLKWDRAPKDGVSKFYPKIIIETCWDCRGCSYVESYHIEQIRLFEWLSVSMG